MGETCKTSQFQVSDQLAAIIRWNPEITLTDDDVKKANAGQLVLVGRGSILPVNPGGLFLPPPGRLIPKGCIDYLFYGSGSEDLGSIRVDGTPYSPSNLKDFREILEQAAFNMKCINFCMDLSTNRMRMVNVYPQCCCECEEVKN